MFAVMVLNTEVDVSAHGIVSVPLIYADGMVGAIPVFGSRTDAERFANGQYSVMEIATPERS